MPPKQKQQKAPVGYKVAALAKDILPATIKNPPREGRSVKVPDAVALQQNQAIANQLNAPLFEEYPKIEEWPGDDVAKNFDFQIEGNNVFVDNNFFQDKLTSSFKSDDTDVPFWRRPNEFIQIEHEEMSQYQLKYNLKKRQSYFVSGLDEGGDVPRIKKHEEFTNSPMKGLSEDPITKVQVKVFEHYEREETQQEFEQRRKEQVKYNLKLYQKDDEPPYSIIYSLMIYLF